MEFFFYGYYLSWCKIIFKGEIVDKRKVFRFFCGMSFYWDEEFVKFSC